MEIKSKRDKTGGLVLNQAAHIIRLQQIVKEMTIANASMDEKSHKWIAHLAKLAQAECLNLMPATKLSDYVESKKLAHLANENG